MSDLTNRMSVTGEGEHGAFSYDIVWTDDFKQLPSEISAICKNKHGKICIVSDSNVSALYLQSVTQVLENEYMLTLPFVFPAGEEQKQLDTIACLYEHLLAQKMERSDILIALGGGVTGDMTGYAAATYRRGIRFVQIPTTLLAQVDSSVGGKTGVDLKQYKNMVGAFHQPSLVYMNMQTLMTLPDEEFVAGMGEVVKTALIRDPVLFSYLENNMDRIMNKDSDAMKYVIGTCCSIKAAVVREDPLDNGLRAILNFGHTIGHAVETQKHFSWLHGQCVALGIAGAAWLSCKRGLLDKADYERIISVLRKYGLPVSVDGLTEDEILHTCMNDKKREAGKLHFVLLNGIGNTCIEEQMTEQELKEAIHELICK